jgi:hypothetical protein
MGGGHRRAAETGRRVVSRPLVGPGPDRRGITLGIVLIGIGVYALLSRGLGFRGPGAVLLLLGAIFFVLSALSRFRGPLLPAGVLLGLGAGLLLRDSFDRWLAPWATILLGLGAGFLMVAGIDAALGRQRRPAPLVPGAVLTGIALAEAAARTFATRNWFDRIETLWPFLLVAAGLLLVVSAARRSRT